MDLYWPVTGFLVFRHVTVLARREDGEDVNASTICHESVTSHLFAYTRMSTARKRDFEEFQIDFNLIDEDDVLSSGSDQPP